MEKIEIPSSEDTILVVYTIDHINIWKTHSLEPSSNFDWFTTDMDSSQEYIFGLKYNA